MAAITARAAVAAGCATAAAELHGGHREPEGGKLAARQQQPHSRAVVRLQWQLAAALSYCSAACSCSCWRAGASCCRCLAHIMRNCQPPAHSLCTHWPCTVHVCSAQLDRASAGVRPARPWSEGWTMAHSTAQRAQVGRPDCGHSYSHSHSRSRCCMHKWVAEYLRCPGVALC